MLPALLLATPTPTPLPVSGPVTNVIYITIGPPPPPPLLSVAPGVVWWQVLLMAAVGAVIGVLSGYMAVWMERHEKLEAEEQEDREAALKDWERDKAEAEKEGREGPPPFDWELEPYGITWMERWASPAAIALLYAVFTLHQGLIAPGRSVLNASLIVHLVWVAVFVHVALFDFKHRFVLNNLVLPAFVLALILAPFTPLDIYSAQTGTVGIVPALEGALIPAVFLAVVHIVTRGGLGLGDAKYIAVVGAATGLDFPQLRFSALYALCFGALIGGAIATVLLVARLRGRKDPIAYAPYLSAGALLVLYWGI